MLRYWRLKLEHGLFFPPYPCLTPPSGGTPCDINVILYTADKYIYLIGYNFVADNLGQSSFVWPLLTPKAAKSPRNSEREFEIIASQGHPHPRSSILVSIESAYATSYWSLIETMGVSATVFEIFTFKARKWLVSHPSLVWRPRSGEPVRISGWNLPRKN